MRFGFHTSLAGKLYLAVDRAVDLRCETMQIFSSSPRSWHWPEPSQADIKEFRRRRARAQILPLTLHAPYLVNLGSGDEEIYSKSLKTLKAAIARAERMKADFLVFHVGSFTGSGREDGLRRVARALRSLGRFDGSPQLLLETTAGSGNALGSTFEELRFLLGKADGAGRLGICFDTAHVFAAGYNLSDNRAVSKTLAEFDKMVGLDKIKLVHANDSKRPCGSRSDRHEDIGRGHIGRDGFKAIVNHPRLRDLPCILETPRTSVSHDLKNLQVLKGLVNKKTS